MAVKEYHYIYERVFQLLEDLKERVKARHFRDDLEDAEELERLERYAELLRKMIKMVERMLSMLKIEADEDAYGILTYSVVYGLWVWLNQLLVEVEMLIEELS
jgi:hypothetical protein